MARLAFWQRRGFVPAGQALEIVTSDLDQRHGCGWKDGLGLFHEPAHKNILDLLQARLAQDEHAEEYDYKDEPRRRTTHSRRS